MNAVITAGGRVDGEFARAIGASVKALAPFRNSTFLHLTIRAVHDAGVPVVAVVGGDEIRASEPGVRIIDEGSTGAENLRRALHAWDENEPLLYLTSDMPFIDASALRWFIEAAPPAALALPLTEWSDFDRRFPQAPPFGIALGGEKVVNGGAFLIPPHAASAIEAMATRFFDARKHPLQMASLAGPSLLLRFVFRRLSIATLESRARQVLGVRAVGVRGAPPELAYDVDVLEEYRYALAHA